MRNFIKYLMLTAPFGVTTTAANAQTNSNEGGEIVVTAQKRAERIQDVPIAVSAVNGDLIADRGFANVAQLSQTAPNVSLSEGIVNPTVIVPFIRGIGTVDSSPETEIPVAISIDGVYLASVYGGLIDAFDIQQVEILRGPQATLQGRNAPGGAINITTRRPGQDWVGRGTIQYGRFNDLRINAGIDGPLIPDVLGIKLVAMRRKMDGYVKNLETGRDFGGRDTWAVKGGIQLTPGERLNAWFSGEYTKDKSPPTGFRPVNDGLSYPRPEYADELNTVACSLFGQCTPYPRYTTGQSFLGNNNITNWALSSSIDYDADAVTLTSVTGYRSIRDVAFLDVDATPFSILHTGPTIVAQKTFSQEFRVSSNPGSSLSFNDKIRWLIGGYYLSSDLLAIRNLFAFGNPAGLDYGQDLKSYSVFGHLDVNVTDQFQLSAGARQNWDKKTFFAYALDATATKSWKKFLFDAGANYKFDQDKMAYFRFARGSRPGGFNQNTIPYDPETVNSWELGLKTRWLDRRLTVNLTGFYYTYDGLLRQTSVFNDATNTFLRITTNAGKSHAYGVELEINARPIDNLDLNFGVGYLNAKYDRWLDTEVIGGVPTIIDNSTLPVLQSPKWTINAGASYEIPISDTGLVGSIKPAINIYYKSAHFTNTEAIPVTYENGYTLLNASLKIQDPSKSYSISMFGDNLLNEYYSNNGGTLGGLSKYRQDALPRTYGVRFEFKIQ